MRLSLPTFSLLTLYLASKAFACVVFSVNVFMYAGNQYEVVGSLIDNGGEVCTVGEDVDPTQIDFVWLNCVDNYAATFSWVGTGSVAYAYPGFEGNFLTNAEYFPGAPPISYYFANVWGC